MINYFYLVFISIGFFLQITLLDMSFTAPNSWREAQTFSVSRNLIEEKFDLLHPRYDWRGTTDGQRGGEFPLYNALSAVTFKIHGINYQSARITSLFFAFLSLILIYFISLKLTTSRSMGLLAVTLFQTNSILSALSISVQPEAVSNFFILSAVACFVFLKKEWIKLMSVILLLSLSSLAKPSGYAAVCFFMMFFLFGWKHEKNKITLMIKAALTASIPLFLTLKWAHFTMATDTVIYPEHPDLFYLTHLYQRGFKDFIQEFTFDTVFHSTKKSIIHSFNIAGVLALMSYGFIWLRKKKSALNTRDWHYLLGFSAWVFCCYFFLLYSGIVQRDQNHYAAPMAIPAIFITTILLSKLNYKIIILFISLQAVAGTYYLEKYYVKSKSYWAQNYAEKFVDSFSTRNDLFIHFNPNGYFDPTVLGQIQRKGIVFNKIEETLRYTSYYPYLFIKTDVQYPASLLALEDLKSRFGTPYAQYENFYFFKLNQHPGL